MKKILFFTLLLIGFCSCNKEIGEKNQPSTDFNDQLIEHQGISISEIEALKVANLFIKSEFNVKTKNGNSIKTIKSVNTISDEAGNPLMYIVNFEPLGFTIVSATKNYAPILAYSDNSQFILDENINQGVKDWLDETKYSIKVSDELPFEEKFKNRIQWIKYEASENIDETLTKAGSSSEAFSARVTQLRESNPGYSFYSLARVSQSAFPLSNTYNDLCNLADGYNSPREYTIIGLKEDYTSETVGPLLTTMWRQGVPYNNHLPSSDYSVGCVTIAVAQIMNFHKYPNSYNWSNMPDSSATDETRRLLSDVGQALNIKYEPGANSASDVEAKKAFEDFDYSATLLNHDNINVRNEINTYKRPVYVSGMNARLSDGGHAWVCDGTRTTNTTATYLVEFLYGGPGYYNFSDNGHYPSQTSAEYLYFHMNWGWGDLENCNGWYASDSTKPRNVDQDYSRSRNDIFVSKR